MRIKPSFESDHTHIDLINPLFMAKNWPKDIEKGKQGETIVAIFLKQQGFQVNRIVHWNAENEGVIFDVEQKTKQAYENIFAPDFLVCSKKEIFFVDAKLKTNKASLGWINKRDYDKYFSIMSKARKFGFRIYFVIENTQEIYVLNKLRYPTSFPIEIQSDGSVYKIPTTLLERVYPE
jgi:hypothetical protein